MEEKMIRFNLFIAVAALLFSGLAAGSSAYQTYVIRKQFSATVWPYLTFNTTSSTDKYFEMDVNNPGIGPALIFDAVVTRDGKPILKPLGPKVLPALAVAVAGDRALAKADEAKSGRRVPAAITAGTISAGDVLPAGQKLVLLRVEGKFITRRVLADIQHIDVTLCYCSLLGDCWTMRMLDSAVRPHPVRACQGS